MDCLGLHAQALCTAHPPSVTQPPALLNSPASSACCGCVFYHTSSTRCSSHTLSTSLRATHNDQLVSERKHTPTRPSSTELVSAETTSSLGVAREHKCRLVCKYSTVDTHLELINALYRQRRSPATRKLPTTLFPRSSQQQGGNSPSSASRRVRPRLQ